MLRRLPFDKCLRALLAVSFGTLLLGACGGNVSANAQAKATSDVDAGGELFFDDDTQAGWETTEDSLNEQQTNATARSSTPQAQNAVDTPTLLGARHDLTLLPGTTERCKCLAAAIGGPSLPAFVWSGLRPSIDSNTQLIVGLSSDGISCAESSTGASYMGYTTQNGDVIVKVEEAVAGRPITRGAVIPRPAEGAQVYIEPVGKIPYGRGLSGEPRCALGR